MQGYFFDLVHPELKLRFQNHLRLTSHSWLKSKLALTELLAIMTWHLLKQLRDSFLSEAQIFPRTCHPLTTHWDLLRVDVEKYL